MAYSTLEFAKQLISRKSVSTLADEGACLKFLASELVKIGFKNTEITFTGDGSYSVDNLYSEFASGSASEGANLCFAGHTDVVHEGDTSAWSVDPYSPQVVDGFLIGRGAVDMKGSIAAWFVAVAEFLSTSPKFNGKLSFLITGDEESDSVNGTKKLLQHITEKNIKITSCIVGEPTNPTKLGEMIKVGRRGSASYQLIVDGIQGHVAYPDLALNPNTNLVEVLSALKKYVFDRGNEFFQATNLEVTSIDTGNPSGNVIPAHASAKFNIRFNSNHNLEQIDAQVRDVISKNINSAKFTLIRQKGACESFLCKPAHLAECTFQAVKEVTNRAAVFSTTGGTSDARFIKDYAEVAEFGLTNATAHKVDEKIEVAALEQLKDIYLLTIKKYFGIE